MSADMQRRRMWSPTSCLHDSLEILPPFPFKNLSWQSRIFRVSLKTEVHLLLGLLFFFILKIIVFIWLFLVAPGLCCCARLSSCSDRGLFSCSAEASCLRAQALQHTSLSSCRHRLSSSAPGLRCSRRAGPSWTRDRTSVPALQGGLSHWNTAVVSGYSD